MRTRPSAGISIHAPPRGATSGALFFLHRPLFQFTPLREGRRRLRRRRKADGYFNSRPSARGDAARGGFRHPGGYFNSRPSARGDEGERDTFVGTCISIHAPPRGATVCRLSCSLRPIFQFTPLREGRPVWDKQAETCQKISIHAPPRGATRYSQHHPERRSHFNSRPSARGDVMIVKELQDEIVFQFTPLREGRQASGARIVYNKKNFNSRPSARGDTADKANHNLPALFQFTPLREGRPERAAATSQGRKFQFTPLREGRHGDGFRRSAALFISIHAPPRGATYRHRRSCA